MQKPWGLRAGLWAREGPGESLERCRVQGGGPVPGKERQVHPLGGEGREGRGGPAGTLGAESVTHQHHRRA